VKNVLNVGGRRAETGMIGWQRVAEERCSDWKCASTDGCETVPDTGMIEQAVDVMMTSEIGCGDTVTLNISIERKYRKNPNMNFFRHDSVQSSRQNRFSRFRKNYMTSLVEFRALDILSLRSAQVWHALSRDFTVLFATHAFIHEQQGTSFPSPVRIINTRAANLKKSCTRIADFTSSAFTAVNTTE